MDMFLPQCKIWAQKSPGCGCTSGSWGISDFVDSGDCHFAVTRQSKLGCPALQGHIQLEGYALLKRTVPTGLCTELRHISLCQFRGDLLFSIGQFQRGLINFCRKDTGKIVFDLAGCTIVPNPHIGFAEVAVGVLIAHDLITSDGHVAGHGHFKLTQPDGCGRDLAAAPIAAGEDTSGRSGQHSGGRSFQKITAGKTLRIRNSSHFRSGLFLSP